MGGGIVRWLKLHFEARNDAKLKALTDAQFRVWFNLLCFAGEKNKDGLISDISRYLLAVEVANGNIELLNETITVLQELRIIEEVPDVRFINFQKRQYDKPSDTPENARERKRKQRARENAAKNNIPESSCHDDITPEIDKTASEFNNVTPMSHDVTPSHALETDTDIDTENVVVNAPVREDKKLFQEITAAIQQIRPITKPMERDLIADMIAHYPRDWIMAAIQIAITKKARTFEYVDGILVNWRKDGFKDEDTPWEVKNRGQPLSGISGKAKKQNRDYSEYDK